MKILANELVVIEKITNDLKISKGNVFPLTPTHRKELRELRANNVSNLHVKIRLIEDELKKQYKAKYSKEIKKEFDIKKKNIELLNNNWIDLKEKLVDLLKTRETFEKSFDLIDAKLENDWNDVCQLDINDVQNFKRKYSFEEEKVLNSIVTKEFAEKFSVNFEKVRQKIQELDTAYEEAINFGDLEIVKKLYYMTKDADTFLDKLKTIKV